MTDDLQEIPKYKCHSFTLVLATSHTYKSAIQLQHIEPKHLPIRLDPQSILQSAQWAQSVQRSQRSERRSRECRVEWLWRPCGNQNTTMSRCGPSWRFHHGTTWHPQTQQNALKGNVNANIHALLSPKSTHFVHKLGSEKCSANVQKLLSLLGVWKGV